MPDTQLLADAMRRGLVQPDVAVLARNPERGNDAKRKLLADAVHRTAFLEKAGNILKNLEANMRLASAASRTLTEPMRPENPLTVAEAESLCRIKKELSHG